MKTSSRHKLILPMAIAASLLASPLAWSGEHGNCDKESRHGKHDQHDRKEMMKERFDHMAERLNLTDEQRDEMKAVFKKGHEARKAQSDKKREDRPKMPSGDPTSSEFKSQVQVAADKAAESARARVQAGADRYAAIYQILNAEQRDTWAEMQAEREAKRGERGHGPRHD
ncbi:Spy/CpxP family protein refolding chaperone [Marinobacter sp. 1Y8]